MSRNLTPPRSSATFSLGKERVKKKPTKSVHQYQEGAASSAPTPTLFFSTLSFPKEKVAEERGGVRF